MKNILITGSSGFVGKAIKASLIQHGYNILAPIRNQIGNIDGNTDWLPYLKNIDIVIHLAARVHIMHDNKSNSLDIFRKVNTEGTKHLVESALNAKVKRFIYLSSLHVNGNFTINNEKLTENSSLNPQTPYAISKLETEQYLNKVASEAGLEVIIIRPPLIYGPEVKGNFLRLLKLVKIGLPFLPFGSLNNKRSMISIQNLISFITLCIENPNAANQTFLISDDDDISTKNLLQFLYKFFNKTPLFLPIPINLLNLTSKLLGQKEICEKLYSSLQVNIDKAKTLLNWQPIQTVNDGLTEVATWFQNKNI